MRHLSEYKTFIFDCDGVLLDSNRIKTEAIRETLLEVGLLKDHVERCIEHHLAHGGISRYEKFLTYAGPELEVKCLNIYAEKIKTSYNTCGTIGYVAEFLSTLSSSSKRIVISGGNQLEVVQALHSHGIAEHFDVILGSPTTKRDNCKSLGRLGQTVYFGDSQLDYELAEEMGWDFVFIYGVTEFANWASFFANHGKLLIKDFQELVK